CFTDVRDAVTALTRLMETPAAFGQTFNVGSSREITIETLARTVLRLTGSKSTLRCIPYEQAYEHGFEDMRRRVPDVSKLRAAIGFVPEIPLERALENIIEHFRSPVGATRQASPRPRATVVIRKRIHPGPAVPAPALGLG